MAIRVQRYDTPTVSNEAINLPRASAPVNELAGLARGLEGATNDIVQIAAEERQKEELTAFNDAKLDMMRFSTELTEGKTDQAGNVVGGLFTRKGTAAKGLEKEAQPEWTKRYSVNFEKLKSYPAAAQLFDSWNKEHWTKTATDLNKHEIRERQAAAIDSQGAIIEQQFEMAINEFSRGKEPDLTAFLGSVNSLGQLKGQDAERLKVSRDDAVSKLYAAAIERQFDQGNIPEAVKLFESKKDSLDPAERGRLEPQVTKAKEIDEGESLAKEVWQSNGPKGLNDAVNLVEMEKKVATIENRNVREHAMRELRDIATRHNRTQTETNQENVGQVYQMMLDRKPYKTIVNSAQFRALPADKQFFLERSVADLYEPKGGPGGGSRGDKEEIKIVRAESLANIIDQIENGEIRVSDPREAFKHVDRLGLGNTTKLYNFINRHNKELKKVPFTKDIFKDTLRELRESNVGFAPNPDSRKAEDRGNMAVLYDRVTEAIANEQQSSGKVLDKEGMKRKVRELLTPTVVNSRWTLGGVNLWKTTEQKPTYKVEKPMSTNVARTLETRLGRKPTKQEIAMGEQLLRGN